MKKFFKKIVPYVPLTLLAVSGCLELFAEHTVAYKIGIGLGTILSVFGIRKGYQYDSLPSGLSKQLDKVPNKYTGVRASKK